MEVILKNQSKSPVVNKQAPTLFVNGFRISEINDGIIILEFFDHENESLNIFGSYALTKSAADQLIKVIKEAIQK